MEQNIYNIFLLYLLTEDMKELNYDYLFIDCPPTSNLLIQSAFLVSDYYIVPTIVDGISAKGVADYISEIEKTRLKFIMNGKIGSILFNKIFGESIPVNTTRGKQTPSYEAISECILEILESKNES